MHRTSCVNCGYDFREGDIYCAKCSQKADTHKLTVGHLLHELFHAVTHADKGILVLIRELALHPGKVAREYVEGKRKRYFNPFTFVLICLSIFLLINNIFHVVDAMVKADPNVLNNLPTTEAKEKYLKIIRRTAEATNFFLKKNNTIYLIAIPLYAGIMWLFFRRRSFAEHLVANMYFNAFLALVSALIVGPLFKIFKSGQNTTALVYIMFFIQFVYLLWAYHGFLGMRKKAGHIQIGLAVVAIMIIWTTISALAFFYYVFGNNAGQVILAVLKQKL